MRIRFRAGHRTIAAAVTMGLTLATAVPTPAQESRRKLDPVYESLHSECEAQYPRPSREDERRARAANVDRCTFAKLQDARHAAVVSPASFNTPVPLLENKPWLIKPNRGPAQAKGVIYFIQGGFNPVNRAVDGFGIVPYYIKSLADDGWDVVRAKVPYNYPGYYIWLYLGGYIQTIQRRVAELHAQGYRHVIAAGHSVGGWTIMMAARDGLAVDATLLDSPNIFGPRLISASGRPNPDFALNLTEFAAALGNDRVPAVVMFPEDEVFEPDSVARGQITEAHFAQANVPHLIIAKPPGFTAHFADWLPVFDYAYGACIRAFLDGGRSGPCATPPLSNSDFRSIAELRQIGDPGARRIVSEAPLAGRKFVAYTLQDIDNKLLTYAASGERTVMVSAGETRETVAFRDGLHCAEQACTLLVQWAPGQILEFDPSSGAIHAWWIEER